MVTVIFILVSLGFYLWYTTSERMKVLPVFGLETWAQNNKGFSKILGSLILIVSLFVGVYGFGLTSGILLFFIVFMTISSLVILLFPLGLINKMSFASLIICLLIIEFLV